MAAFKNFLNETKKIVDAKLLKPKKSKNKEPAKGSITLYGVDFGGKESDIIRDATKLKLNPKMKSGGIVDLTGPKKKIYDYMTTKLNYSHDRIERLHKGLFK